MTVAGRISAGNHAVSGHERINAADFLGRDDLHVEPDDLRIAVDIFEPRQLALIGRKADTARFVPADILPRQRFQPGI